jgi:hypothetical protein
MEYLEKKIFDNNSKIEEKYKLGKIKQMIWKKFLDIL